MLSIKCVCENMCIYCINIQAFVCCSINHFSGVWCVYDLGMETLTKYILIICVYNDYLVTRTY